MHPAAHLQQMPRALIRAVGDDALEEDGPRPEHKRYRGNQPSSTVLLDKLTPATLGSLIALYEHKVFVQAVIWDINPFDQWGLSLANKLPLTPRPLSTVKRVSAVWMLPAVA